MRLNLDAIFTGIGILIALYLLVYYGKNSTALVGTSGNVLVGETKTLQGR